ncbi:LUNG SEVEN TRANSMEMBRANE RECEPTOR [Salix purpurea]|uniref:LUNG SEVEN TRANSMEMBRANE RECEPTOR n=1 Tax=Salix purpurea TaxID=77065 RepID=A0A9Q0TH02_SALPP|nr:LUNG SEVEN TRANSMEMBRANE RECEPTOR [Salix purpurea]
MSFGVYVTGVLFQTAYFVSFILISHGYCIMYEHISISDRRTTAALGCVFYLTLVGYRASVPYFTVLLLLNYLISFSMIFRQISQNLSVLREQLSFVEEEDVQAMYDAVYMKYTMFKKFQGAMQIVVMAETVIHFNVDSSSVNYWLRLLVREWAQFCIFLYIGWTFRSQAWAPRFSVMPRSKGELMVPPIYSIVSDFFCVWSLDTARRYHPLEVFRKKVFSCYLWLGTISLYCM